MALGNDSLAQVISDALEARLVDLHVCMPGIVQSYDPATQLAFVQPCIQRKFQDGTLVALPVISNVPVAHPRGGSGFIHLPIAPGDPVTLVFAERSLDNWLSQGGVVDPSDPRKHHLSDAIAVPGGSPATQPLTVPNPSDLCLVNGQASIQIQKGGKFLIKGSSDELLDVLVQLLNALLALKTLDPLTGPQPLDPSTINALNPILNKLTGLKGS